MDTGSPLGRPTGLTLEKRKNHRYASQTSSPCHDGRFIRPEHMDLVPQSPVWLFGDHLADINDHCL